VTSTITEDTPPPASSPKFDHSSPYGAVGLKRHQAIMDQVAEKIEKEQTKPTHVMCFRFSAM
jgi:hypothetical protein